LPQAEREGYKSSPHVLLLDAGHHRFTPFVTVGWVLSDGSTIGRRKTNAPLSHANPDLPNDFRD